MKGLNISRPWAVASLVALLGVATFALTACGADQTPAGGVGYDDEVEMDGSSTVTPVFEAVVEEFSIVHPEATGVTVSTSGTGGGFKRFCAGETDVSMASRPIKDSEVALCAENGVEFIELPIAYDGLTVVVNNDNDWAETLTVEELNKIWADGSTVNNWSQVRAGFPNEPIKLYGPGTDSGTFDYFTLAINGEEGSSRADYQASEDDNVLVQGVIGDKGALGYFGYAYYAEQPDKMKAVKIVSPKTGEAIGPSEATIKNATYQPLSRPLFIYVNKASAEGNKTLDALVKYLFSAEGIELVASTGYVPLPQSTLDAVLEHYNARRTGTNFAGAEVGVSVEAVLAAAKG